MKISEIHYSSHFLKALRKLEPELKTEVTKREKLFRNNCFDKKLRTHKLTGKLKNYWAFSITYKHRVLFEFLGEGKVAFVDVGDHSIYE